MLKKQRAFTLVELIVGITLSMLLMMSVWVFVSSGMSHIKLQTDVLNESTDIMAWYTMSQKLFSSSEKVIWTYPSWVLLKVNPEYDNGTYAFLWSKSINSEYCKTGDTQSFNHIYSSTFIPYEEINENINTDFSSIQTSAIVTVSWGQFKTDTKKHWVFKKVWADWVREIGKDIFGHVLVQGSSWSQVFLNSPTGIVNVQWVLVFSDTLNNRILYYEWWKVYTLLDENDWLNQPTWLAYSSVRKELFIANSWKGEILSFSSKGQWWTGRSDISLDFVPENNFVADGFDVSILIGPTNILAPASISNYTFSPSNIQNALDTVSISWNTLSYSFNTADPLVPRLHTFSSWNTYSVGITWVQTEVPDSGNYYIELNMKNATNSVYKKVFPYFVEWDDNIFTKGDNVLQTIHSNLLYPTGIEIVSNQIHVNTFEDRKLRKYDFDGTLAWPAVDRTPLFSQNIFDIQYAPDYIMKNPLHDFTIVYNDPSNRLLHMNIEYYKYFNCYNNDENIIRTFVLKKNYE